jgi:cold shock CspA family protein
MKERLRGRVVEWNDERGFGFVTQNGTGARVFLHVSELSASHRRPGIGSLITYELGKDDKGRIQARNAQFVGAGTSALSGSKVTLPSAMVGLIVLLVIGYVGYVRISNPNSTVSASVYKIIFARDALRSHPEFQCRPEKNSCSKMTSCAEALFHQERCGIANMDGDHDGIPCEQQWCK